MPENTHPQAQEAYRRFAEYYDLYVDGFDADFALYLHVANPARRVLEIGCGSGRLLKPLLAAGISVVGVDISADMLALAEAKLSDFIKQKTLQLINHNFVLLPMPEKFERVLVAFYTFNYLLDPEQAVRFLQNVSLSMERGAILVLDLFYPSAYAEPAHHARWTEKHLISPGGREITLLDRRTMQEAVEKREQIYEENGERQSIVTYRRFYDKQEMAKMLRTAGFRNLLITDGYDYLRFHEIDPAEATRSSFVLLAIKGGDK